MRVIVTDTLGDLQRDLERIVKRAPRDVAKALNEGQKAGTALAREHAIRASGPHGKNYYKRITGEMLTPTSAEFGPTADEHGLPVGAGYRHGPPNRDLAHAGDNAIGLVAQEIRKAMDGWFW